jgi:hypothetical protein
MKKRDEQVQKRLIDARDQLSAVMRLLRRDGLTPNVKVKQKAANATYQAAMRDMRRKISSEKSAPDEKRTKRRGRPPAS